MTFRSLHIADQEWKYFVGQKNVVIKYPGEEKKKVTVPVELITGDLEPTRFGGNPVKPSQIKVFIEKNILRTE